jgi:ATPase subunit of ABC transporter with duplicated ATPase domains
MLLVTHDRDLAKRYATRIIEPAGGGIPGAESCGRS